MKLLIASDMNTPSIPIKRGRIIVRGATIITFLKIEKKIAYLDLPNPTATD